MRNLEKRRLSMMRKIREVKISQNQLVNQQVIKHALLEEGVDSQDIELPINIIEFQSLNRKYRGIGIMNSKGGYEFYNRSIMDYPVCVGKKGLTIIPGTGEKKEIACCFHDSLDYMAWFSYMQSQNNNSSKMMDCYIMGDFSAFSDLMKVADKYDKVLCYFHNTQCGEVMLSTLKEKAKKATVVDRSCLYKSFECMRYYWMDLLTRK